MARRGNRRRAQVQSKRFNVPKPSNTPPKPADAPAPSPRPTARPAPVRRPRRPSLSAQERARLLGAIQQQAPEDQSGASAWANVFAPARQVEKPEGIELDAIEWWSWEMAKAGNDRHLFTYQPTRSSFPPRPRTIAAGYVERSRTLYVRFRNGQVYAYYDVPPNIWRRFKQVDSPGRYINAVLNFYPYAHIPELRIYTGRD